MSSNFRSVLSRPWVLVTTGFIAAYGSYVIWSSWPSQDAPTTLRRRGAVRSRDSSRVQTRIWTSPSSEPSLPFGLVHVDFEGKSESQRPPFISSLFHPGISLLVLTPTVVVRFPNGPEPPTVAEIQEALNLPNSRAFDLTIKIQEAALKYIFSILAQPPDDLSAEQSDASSDLQELTPYLRQPNIDELLARIHVLCSGSWKFHQAAVARAFADLCGLDRMPIIPDDTDLDYTETDGSDHEDEREPAQGIKGVLYNIAEEKAMRELYVHTGIRCEQCGQYPIRGVRWHCNNCPDFDLCSTCEAHPLHPRTHVFSKIKVPIAFLSQNHQVHDVSYPGDPMAQWPTLKPSLKKQLAIDTGIEELKIQVAYDQFTCKANTAYPEDPMQVGIAVDRHAFNKLMVSPTWKRPLEPNCLYDRMFNYYDTDNNGLIGFKEYIQGIAYLRRPNKQSSSMDRIFLGFDFDGDGYISRRDFIRMLSAKYAVQKKIVGDMIRAAEYDMVGYSAHVIRSSQPISAAFAHEDVPPGQTRTHTMFKGPDRFGEYQIRPGAGAFASAVLPDGLEHPDTDLMNTMAHRYGDGMLPGHEASAERYSLEQLTEFTSSLNLAESVEIDHGEDQEPRFMVDTDLRHNRSRLNTDEPEYRWRQDIKEASQDTDQSSEKSVCEGSHADEDDFLPPLPADILERGRAYEVPVAEKDFGTEVIFQVIQEGLNEMIDPIFAQKERLAERVQATLEERHRYRQEIDEYVRDAKARQEELSIGAEIDPLMGIANAANSEDLEYEREYESGAHNDTLLQTESLDAGARLPTPREIAIDLQEHITQQSQTLDGNLDDLESNIREQSLDELLAQSGYIIDGSSDLDTASADRHDDELGPDGSGLMVTSTDEEDIPLDVISSDNLSPPTQHNQAPFSTPDIDSSSSEFSPFQPDQTEQPKKPTKDRLRELAQLDEEEKVIVARGGPGRLNLEEFEQIIRVDQRGMLQGVAEGWLEWAEF
ncbi:hypothetical protein E4T39_07974 [Aureobasidium subglaciale]|nr:hypothetical protein E4T39_07974 [Aureobasidium subglaciale]